MTGSDENLTSQNIKESLVADILAYIRENTTILKKEDLRTRVNVENLMLREYFHDPDISFSECRKLIQPQIPEYQLTDLYIKERAAAIGLSERSDRRALTEWAKTITELIYKGMAGDHASLQDAANRLNKPSSKSGSKQHPSRHRLILTGLFETIPVLRRSEERQMLLQFGKPYSIRCLNKIINSALYDTASSEEKIDISGKESVEQLMRELYIARKELSDYKELTEAADAEFEDRLTALKDGEVIEFFSRLADPKYGYLIDSVFAQYQAFRELKRSGAEIPYQIEGAPIVLKNLIQFLKEAGISPAAEFPPNSLQHLTVEDLNGVTFLPDFSRKGALGETADILVRVVSAGWKYKDLVISQPVYQELSRTE